MADSEHPGLKLARIRGHVDTVLRLEYAHQFARVDAVGATDRSHCVGGTQGKYLERKVVQLIPEIFRQLGVPLDPLLHTNLAHLVELLVEH